MGINVFGVVIFFKKERQSDRDRERHGDRSLSFADSLPKSAWARPGQCQEPGSLSQFPMWAVGTQVLGLSCAASQVCLQKLPRKHGIART